MTTHPTKKALSDDGLDFMPGNRFTRWPNLQLNWVNHQFVSVEATGESRYHFAKSMLETGNPNDQVRDVPFGAYRTISVVHRLIGE
jgi:hypothetical protein